MKIATLCLVIKDNQILLGNKKIGFGKDKLNGFGGKQNPGETIEQATVRELREESSLLARVEDLEKVAEVDFSFPEKVKDWNQIVHVYILRTFLGIPKESEEMTCEWHQLDSIPYGKMWDSDKYWLPLVLKGKRIKAKISFGEDTETVKKYQITEI